MTSNREWLYSLDVADLSDWLDAEHESCAQYADQPKRPEAQDCGSDSREKLEADVYQAADDMEMLYCGEMFLDTRKIIGWLDRQASITEREWHARWTQQCIASAQLKGELLEAQAELEQWRGLTNGIELPDYPIAEFQPKDKDRRIAELTAERDEWKTICETREFAYKQADAERKRYSEQIDELTVERDEYRERLGTCADLAEQMRNVAMRVMER